MYKEPNIISAIKASKIRWLGHIMRINDRDIPKRLLFSETWGHRREGRPKLSWLDGLADDLTKIGVRNWRRKAQDRDTHLISLSKFNLPLIGSFYVTHAAWALQSHDLLREGIKLWITDILFDHTRTWRASPDD